ncbi:OPT family oligopeptide transporter [Sphingomonas nostoxanthinifaciens]|uniref:OPT family oligopeptide transporter n=1 Tax=Sphingomonas nostoxanthinifaciens TaxID=2872652 RepID=UPI001CC1EB57|nr:oligopeptide transporter, OPT family [Sphingomonas nostoxanthinifaciens]UAK23946.1 oligopeptide transporter, OPT family [Sphingomonas nostoxanthinifaciens]
MTARSHANELTLRGVVLGCLITLAFTAANLYLGLKIGLTFATSIPAAVISMALLRGFRSSNIFENNIVQTIASAAGTLSSIGFVLPGLVMTGWWSGFDYWTSFWVCAIGGLLGVLFSVPLRRALVTGSDLPYPEGVAAAAVLEVGSETAEGAAESKAGLRVIVVGSIASAAYAALAATQIAASEVSRWFRIGAVGSGFDATLSFALIGAGHLVGLTVGVAIFAGLVLGFGIVTPFLTWLHGQPDMAEMIWRHDVRFFGAGLIGISAIWTLGQLVMPIARGLSESLAASRQRKAGTTALAIEEQDIPLGLLGLGLAALLLPIAWVLWRFVAAGPLAPYALPLAAMGVVYVVIAGAIVAAVCGYMAGLIGASNSPVSGLGILGIVGAGLLLALFVQPHVPAGATPHLVAFAIFLTALIFSAATIANDNLQDLKTGQLVGATPWKQQVALMIGVIAGSLVIPFVLGLLNRAYGFAPLVGAPPANPLGAPQATLIATLAKGVLGAGLDWSVIGAGAAAGAVLIVIDAALKRRGGMHLPPLAVGLGVYLPMGATLPVVIGAVIGHLYERRTRTEAAQRTGVLLASGFIVGDGLFGVALAGLIVATGSGAPLALVGTSFATPGIVIGLALFAGLLAVLYRWTARVSARLG